MEISGVVGSVKKTCLSLSSEWRPRITSVSLVLPSSRSIDFSDKSHLTYYYHNHPNGNVKPKLKLKLKLVAASKKSSIDALSTNQKLKLLKSFADSSNKLSLEEAGAAFLNEVDKVRAEEKQEKKHKKMKKQKRKSESSSESSSSSESECGEVIDNRERHEEEMNTRVRVDVCMGNKCKKLGGESILAEFQSQISAPNAVVACKCMGNCKSAPNVRLTTEHSNSNSNSNSNFVITNPLYIGVGLEDVTSIISSFFAASDSASSQHSNNNNIAFPAASP